MALRAIPARGGLGWAWLTLAWAVMVRPTISAAAAAVVMTAVIQRRMRRVIAVSFTRCIPRSADHWGFEAAATADGCRTSGQEDARPPGSFGRLGDGRRGWAGGWCEPGAASAQVGGEHAQRHGGAQQPGGRVEQPGHAQELHGERGIVFGRPLELADIGIDDAYRQGAWRRHSRHGQVGAGGQLPDGADWLGGGAEVSVG